MCAKGTFLNYLPLHPHIFIQANPRTGFDGFTSTHTGSVPINVVVMTKYQLLVLLLLFNGKSVSGVLTDCSHECVKCSEWVECWHHQLNWKVGKKQAMIGHTYLFVDIDFSRVEIEHKSVEIRG